MPRVCALHTALVVPMRSKKSSFNGRYSYVCYAAHVSDCRSAVCCCCILRILLGRWSTAPSAAERTRSKKENEKKTYSYMFSKHKNPLLESA